ncbi:uncharacterized protein LOC126419428 [Schistocerca serialis cubense]|uniref:uncharacterized protein LOC126419428 n=1 Tax=Schistocerca serialis cubense TaxID=2023355 RepID=UPI00214E19DE|nr:uncharacterized protein LOC126419428 [Schistocerca serialis cubense]
MENSTEVSINCAQIQATPWKQAHTIFCFHSSARKTISSSDRQRGRTAEESPVIEELYKRMKLADSLSLTKGLLERTQAVIMSDSSVKTLKKYNPHKANKLYTVRGIQITVPLAYVVRIDCPIKEQVETIIWRLWESGIGDHSDREVERRELRYCTLPEDVPQPFTLSQFKMAFYTLFFGLCLSSFVFLLEIVNYKTRLMTCLEVISKK